MVGVRQFDENEVLNQALMVFWQKGYKSTSMIDLAKSTGVQRGSLYNAYGRKSTLFAKAFDQYTRRLLTEVESTLAASDIKTSLLNMFFFFSNRLCSDKKRRGCLSTKTIMEANLQDTQVHTQLKNLMDNLETLIEKRLKQATREGQFFGDCKKSARYLVTLSRGLAVVERVYCDQSRIQEIYCSAIEMLPFTQK